MAQAGSVPTAIPKPITGVASKASTNRGPAGQCWLIGGSAPYIPPIESDASFLEHWREICRRADPDNRREAQNRHWHTAITGRMPPGWYLVAVCYATVTILLGCYPWNVLLIWLLFSGSKHLQLSSIGHPAKSGWLRSHGGR